MFKNYANTKDGFKRKKSILKNIRDPPLPLVPTGPCVSPELLAPHLTQAPPPLLFNLYPTPIRLFW